MPKIPNKYADFSDLEELFEIMTSRDIGIGHGCYDADTPHPGPHVIFATAHSKSGYDFIKQKDGTYILCIRKNDKKK